jgi:signal transduction histidine kinase
VKRYAWVVFVVVGGCTGVAYFALPQHLQLILYDLMAVAGAGALALGGRVMKPAGNGGPWYWLAGGIACWAVGDAIWSSYELVGRVAPYPSVADVIYLAAYPLFATGLLILVRRRGGRDRGALVDATIVATAAMLLSWVMFIHPLVTEGDPLPTVAVSISYPLADVLVLAVLIRMLLAPGRRTPAFRLLLLGLCATLGADVAYSVALLGNGYTTGMWMDAGWLGFYLLWGAAGLHPSMAAPPAVLDEPRPYRRPRMSMLVVALLLAPTALVLASMRHESDHLPVLAAISAVLMVLVIVRMRLLVLDVDVRATELGAALDELHRLERQRAELLDETVRASEAERTRTAAELHDGPIQHLSVVSFRLHEAKARLERGDPGAAIEVLKTAQRSLGSDIAELRRMMTDLRPPALDEGGLEAALSDLTNETARRGDLQVDLHTRIDHDLDTDIETIVYRVAQEALTNVVRHARASRVSVDVVTPDGHVDLVVRDDGAGFDPSEGERLLREGHFGLAGMRERVQMASGSWSVRSEPGNGTTVEVRLPVAVQA